MLGEVVNLDEIEAAARSLSEVLHYEGLGAFDIDEEMLALVNGLALRALGRRAHGVEAGLCIGLSSPYDMAGEVLGEEGSLFVGTLDKAATVVAPNAPFIWAEHVADELAVPALLFEPIDIRPLVDQNMQSVGEEFDSIATLYPRVAVPLVGVPLHVERLVLIQ